MVKHYQPCLTMIIVIATIIVTITVIVTIIVTVTVTITNNHGQTQLMLDDCHYQSWLTSSNHRRPRPSNGSHSQPWSTPINHACPRSLFVTHEPFLLSTIVMVTHWHHGQQWFLSTIVIFNHIDRQQWLTKDNHRQPWSMSYPQPRWCLIQMVQYHFFSSNPNSSHTP